MHGNAITLWQLVTRGLYALQCNNISSTGHQVAYWHGLAITFQQLVTRGFYAWQCNNITVAGHQGDYLCGSAVTFQQLVTSGHCGVSATTLQQLVTRGLLQSTASTFEKLVTRRLYAWQCYNIAAGGHQGALCLVLQQYFSSWLPKGFMHGTITIFLQLVTR